MGKKKLGKEPFLTITGKPIQIPALVENKSKKKLKSPEVSRRGSPLRQSQLEKTFQSYLASGISFIAKKRNSTILIGNVSKSVIKKPKLKTISESFELENGSKIYKCMSNPNVNGNSNTLGLPIRACTVNNENSIVYKFPVNIPKRVTNTPVLKR